ncbi:hypothetical protein AAMO2058_000628100 [Amorphochlora amoebiformis]
MSQSPKPSRSSPPPTLILVALISCLLTTAILTVTKLPFISPDNQACPLMDRSVYHGGNPKENMGSCVCGKDGYCMCTPSLAIDSIIEVEADPNFLGTVPSILLVYRRDPPANVHAIIGGFVEIGESTEAAVCREVKEETTIQLNADEDCSLWTVKSEPKRDKRRHTVSVIYRCMVDSERGKNYKPGDDAKGIVSVSLHDLPNLKYGFDHREILREYMDTFYPDWKTEWNHSTITANAHS